MTDERWMYQADAVPCAANITRPFRDSWVLSAALPVVGGRSEIQHNATAFRNIFAIESAYALLTGEETPDDQVETTLEPRFRGLLWRTN
jgi:hypothetical protein